MAKRKIQPLSTTERSDLVESLQSEYGIIQTKIDNIGNFKFVVRGWLITIYSAFVFGVFSDLIPGQLCLWLGCLIILVFHFLEREQIINQNKLSDRSKLIESSIYKLSLIKYSNPKKEESVLNSVIDRLGSVPRISGVLTAKRVYKVFKKDDPRPRNFFSRKLWSWIYRHAQQAIKWFFSIKVFWLFWLLYIVTVGMHIVINSDAVSEYFKLKEKKEEAPTEISIYKNDNRFINHRKYMRENSSIETVEEEMYSLVAQIDHGDISDIDTYWESLREALRELEIKDWSADVNLSSAGLIESLPVNGSEELCELAVRMKELCDSGSNSSISDEKLDELQDLAGTFEKGFEELLNELDKIAKK
jgi:hypothetical protein